MAGRRGRPVSKEASKPVLIRLPMRQAEFVAANGGPKFIRALAVRAMMDATP